MELKMSFYLTDQQREEAARIVALALRPLPEMQGLQTPPPKRKADDWHPPGTRRIAPRPQRRGRGHVVALYRA